jgi:hypothetical protein
LRRRLAVTTITTTGSPLKAATLPEPPTWSLISASAAVGRTSAAAGLVNADVTSARALDKITPLDQKGMGWL